MSITAKLYTKNSLQKLKNLNNKKVEEIIETYAALCQPAKITVLDNSPKDQQYIRQLAIKNGEEKPLTTTGHTYHFDGIQDQGRDKEKTKVLFSDKNLKLNAGINICDRKTCLAETHHLLKGTMKGREMLVSFFCLGPNNSDFSLLAMQITDSAYVVHSENILYRDGYQDFIKLKGTADFFYFIHSQGKLVNNVSSEPDKKRIYVDLDENRVFSVNTQYAGNSVGLKKLALRLAIKKSSENRWLCEHMLVLGARPLDKKRVTYFTGAFPSACGKTSTAMIPGQNILGDDIAYLRRRDGRAFAANVEQGIFGIIEDVNPADDPLIYKALTTPRELIFSNVLISNNKPYWSGMGSKLPEQGLGWSGKWNNRQTDKNGKPISPSHKNARYTIKLSELPNIDSHLHDPLGVPIEGIIYGGRDSDTSPPVVEAFNWEHGVMMGAAIESETTAATLGETGVRKHNPMANLDFMVIPVGTYIRNHLEFGAKLQKSPKIFTTNYFLKKDGQYLNRKTDKKVWLLWMEGRVHGDFEAIETPIGYLPKYEDLTDLFWQLFRKNYSEEDYKEQFFLRKHKLLAKLERIKEIFSRENNIPPEIFRIIKNQILKINTL